MVTLQSLKSDLDSKFNVVCLYDLADTMVKHGEIFKIFKKHYLTAYTPVQRLVFYTSLDPSQLVLNHLQRAATKIDISNYFIVICCPHNIESKLKTANEKYGNDNVVITWYPCLLEQTTHISADNIYPFDTFCAVPFGITTISTAGLTKPCCRYQGYSGSIDNFDFNNNEVISQIRTDIKHARRHQNCKSCWKAEEFGQTSFRQIYNIKYEDQFDLDWVDSPGPRDLTVSPSNLCNFKCRICFPGTSSKVASEKLKFASDLKEKQKLKNIINISKNNNITADKILSLAAELKYLHILGGEPFLWPELNCLLDKLIDHGLAKNIQIEFNTNGSLFPNQIISKLLKFKFVEILISIDDIGKRFELQRGGKWESVLQNVLSFKKLKCANFSVKVSPTVNIQNLLYLDQLVDFYNQHNLEIVWTFLENPYYFSIDQITEKMKNIVYEKYIGHPNLELQMIAKRMHQTAAVDGQLFLHHMNQFDQRRDQNSKIILKELFDAMS